VTPAKGQVGAAIYIVSISITELAAKIGSLMIDVVDNPASPRIPKPFDAVLQLDKIKVAGVENCQGKLPSARPLEKQRVFVARFVRSLARYCSLSN